jgi:hypothetical protein
MRKQTEMVDFLKQQGAKEPVVVNPDAPYGEYGAPYGEGQAAVPGVLEAVPEVVIDPNVIRPQVAAFAGLAEAIKVVDDKGISEQKGWMQRRVDNRTIQIRAGEKQFNEELAFVKKTATEEKAAKTITVIDELSAKRKTRCDDVYKELSRMRRAAMQETRTQRPWAAAHHHAPGPPRSGAGQGSDPYETTTARMRQAARPEPNEPPIDPVTAAQIDAWLEAAGARMP